MPTPGYLIGYAISPVQSFIREARKAQDYWSGSLLLSHLAQASLATLDAAGTERVSPAHTDAPDSRSSVTNEGMAFFIGTLEEARTLARKTAQAARDRWATIAKSTREILEENHLFRDESEWRLWDEQIAAQFSVVWAIETVVDSEGPDFADALERLHRHLDGAKRARLIAEYTGDSRAKCTLSGDWEQMGPDADFWREIFPRRLRQLNRRERVRWAVTARIEAGGRERLCAVSLVRRLAPVLVLLHDKPETNLESPVRFPSTTAVAWIETKARLLRLATDKPDEFLLAVDEFNQAVAAWCDAADLPQGRHVLACHETLLAGTSGELRMVLQTFLRLDGSFLAENERDDPPGFEEDSAKKVSTRSRLRSARNRLRDLAPTIGIGRTPPLALLRIDGDRIGQLASACARVGGMAGAIALSQAIADQALTKARLAVEKHLGKVLFDGGDEIVALLPASHALDAAEEISQAFEAAHKDLTCSAAIVMVAPNSPLRVAIMELTKLLEETKDHRRREEWPGGERDRTRRSLGLAIIPGSGNIKRGVVGLCVPRFTDAGVESCRVITEVLLPLANALVREDVEVSPKLYREWLEEFAELEDNDQVRGAILPETRSENEGIALAEFRRLASRHVQGGTEERREAVIVDLTARLKSLLLSGSFYRDTPRRTPRWSDLSGLLLAVTTLGTREIGG